MSPEKLSDSSEPKREVVRIIVEGKKQIIAKHKSGMYVFILVVNNFVLT